MERARSKRPVIAIGVLAVLLIIAVKGCYSNDLVAAARHYDDELAAAKKSGLITDFADYHPPVVAPDQNAAPLYKKAISELPRYKEAFEQIAKKNVDHVKLDAALVKIQPVLAQFSQASKRPSVDFGRKWHKGIDLELHELGAFHFVSEILKKDAKEKLNHGDVRGAIDDAAVVARLSRHLGQEPVIIAAVYQAMLVDEAFSILSQAIEEHGGDAAVRDGVRTAVAEMGPPPDIRLVMQLELPVQLQVVESLRNGTDMVKAASGSVPSTARLGRYAFARDAYKARVIEYWRALYAKLPEDKMDYFGAYQSINDLHEEFEHHHTGISYSMLDHMRLTFSGGSISMARAETEKRLLLGAVDLIEGKADIPKDPFSGKPMIFSKGLLYSVGENQKDDHGSTKRNSNDSQPEDYVVKVVRL